MNSLKIKILGIILGAAVVAIGLATWNNLTLQHKLVDQVAQESMHVLGEAVRNSIRTAMAAGKNEEVTNIILDIRNEHSVNSSVTSIHISSPSGKILRSTNTAEVGKITNVHTLASDDTIVESRGEYTYRSITPIYNDQVCFGCHPSNIKLLGILDISMALPDLAAVQASNQSNVIFTSLLMLFVIVSTTAAFFLIYIDKPLKKIIDAMGRVEFGDLSDVSTDLRSSSEMMNLSRSFNIMVKRLSDLIETKVMQEKELAIQDEKLSHHEEIAEMNHTLEERLGEIEQLNITLEERLEDIEEANFRIADLAGDLESKNTDLQHNVERLSSMYKMGLAVNSTMDIDKLFSLLLHKTSEAIRAKIGYLLLKKPNRNGLVVGGSVGITPPDDPDFTIPLKKGGVSHWVLQNSEPMLLANIPESEFNIRSLLGFDRKSVICAPLIIKGEAIGTLTIANKIDGSDFTVDDLEMLNSIAAQASVAMNNAHLYEEQEKTYLSTVQSLVTAIEASDSYTRGHSERVTRYSMAIAKAMNSTPEFIVRLEKAAVLHDIGKIGINIEVLHKEGKLSTNDIDHLQQHPAIGAMILEPVHFLQDVREIILQHHERFDGNGYPNGIKKDDIRQEARILAVADTYDAMTSDRPYRKALSHAIAIQELKDHAGSQFDPDVVDAFIELSRSSNNLESLRAVGEN